MCREEKVSRTVTACDGAVKRGKEEKEKSHIGRNDGDERRTSQSEGL